MNATASYQALIVRFPLRPIRDEATLDAASALADELAGRAELHHPKGQALEPGSGGAVIGRDHAAS